MSRRFRDVDGARDDAVMLNKGGKVGVKVRDMDAVIVPQMVLQVRRFNARVTSQTNEDSVMRMDGDIDLLEKGGEDQGGGGCGRWKRELVRTKERRKERRTDEGQRLPERRAIRPVPPNLQKQSPQGARRHRQGARAEDWRPVEQLP